MQRRLVFLLLAFLTGCARNEIRLSNEGARDWQQIEVEAAGHVFQIQQIKGGETETLQFKSKAEGGGLVRGSLEGEKREAGFGYFTPNLVDQYEIIFRDDGTIKIQQGAGAGGQP
ncbi:MAG: hypothetical protein QGH11_12005 [Pirellulaceae bacterium]|nr:hypothetical protein [Pirellulaceae bacterium]